MDYFGIDPITGVITLLGDLTMEVYDEYKLEVLAHDMGKQTVALLEGVWVRGDGIGSGLSSMGRSWDALVGGKNVNKRPKTTPSTGSDGITR